LIHYVKWNKIFRFFVLSRWSNSFGTNLIRIYINWCYMHMYYCLYACTLGMCVQGVLKNSIFPHHYRRQGFFGIGTNGTKRRVANGTNETRRMPLGKIFRISYTNILPIFYWFRSIRIVSFESLPMFLQYTELFSDVCHKDRLESITVSITKIFMFCFIVSIS
jgi:hypothetical protein